MKTILSDPERPNPTLVSTADDAGDLVASILDQPISGTTTLVASWGEGDDEEDDYAGIYDDEEDEDEDDEDEDDDDDDDDDDNDDDND